MTLVIAPDLINKKPEKEGLLEIINKEGLAALNNESVVTPDDGDKCYCWREEYKKLKSSVGAF